MKKFTFILLVLMFCSNSLYANYYLDKQLNDVHNNTKYSQAEKLKKSYNVSKLEISDKDIKDPGLIKLSECEKIPAAKYNKKMALDNAEYKKYTGVNFYRIYRITERILRANNLAYTNWRIVVRKDVEEVNAYASVGNLIVINTALYDCIGDNDDALAFVLAHELSHHILGHNQRSYEINKEFKKLSGQNCSDLAVAILVNEIRKMEYMADAEAVTLLSKAGYSLEKSMDALVMLGTLPSDNSVYNTHPDTKNRIENYKQCALLADPNWELIGKQNIYNSEVLVPTKSSDRASVIINKPLNVAIDYVPETFQERLTRFAYMNYKRGNMEEAIKYFKKLASKDKNNYIPYLYISYANEYLYKQTSDSKYLKLAKKAAEKAKSKGGTNKYIQEQIDSL